MMKPNWLAVQTLSVVLLGVTAVGCGGNTLATIEVTGTVTHNGAPVEGAYVMFSPVEPGQGNPGYAVTDANGRYALATQQGAVGAGTTPGHYKVTVTKTRRTSTGKTETTPEGEMVEVMENQDLLPRRYKFAANTPLSAQVVEGQPNQFDFTLE